METKLNYEVIKILLAEFVLSFLPVKGKDSYLPYLNTSQVTTVKK